MRAAERRVAPARPLPIGRPHFVVAAGTGGEVRDKMGREKRWMRKRDMKCKLSGDGEGGKKRGNAKVDKSVKRN